MAPLQIFKPGRHTATNGKVIEFTESQLKASADAYKPELHDAPFVVGHPKTDAPAYGWTKSLAFDDGVLAAEPHLVDAQFQEMVNAGRFNKISASFYEPDAPGNPVPGVYYLRHVGFLGAQAPSVRGLKSASFAGDEKGVIEFADWGESIVASLFRSIRDAWIAKFGKEEADKTIPDYSVTALTEHAAQGDSMTHSYAAPSQEENDMQLTKEQLEAQAKDLKAKEDKLAADRAEFAEREKAVKAQEEKNRRAGLVEFADTLVKEGKILPRDKDGLVAYMAGPNDAGMIEFSEGETKYSVNPADWLKKFLAALPKQVDYAEHSARTEVESPSVSFAAPPGYVIDPERLELHNKALAWQQQHPNTSYDAAIAAVTH
jgi:hypothetical protein